MTEPPREPPPPEPFPLKRDAAPPPPPTPFFLAPEGPRPAPPPVPPDAPPPRPVPRMSSTRESTRDAERRARARRGEEPPKKKGRWVLFLLVNFVLVGCAVFWMTRSEEQRRSFLEAIPPGVGGRVVATVAALVLMLVLAWLVLPGARAAVIALTRANDRFRDMPRGKRLLLLPVRAGLEVVWLGAQVLFALDAIAILGSGVAFLLYAIRIAKPEMFPFLP